MGNIIDADSDLFPGTNKLKVIQYTGVYFKDIIGQTYVKKQLNECINFMNNQQEFKKYEYKMPRGILFVGPPGTGKTMIAKALATEAAVNFISVTASDFENAYYGSGPKNVHNLFKVAKRNAPCIIYIDEIDSISSRSNFKSYDKSDLINTLLVELDGFTESSNVLVIGATNNPDKIDPAILRSGRFDKEIVFDLPNADERKQYFETINKKFFSKEFLNDYDNNVATLTRYTTGLSLADLNNIVNCAKSKFLERISIVKPIIHDESQEANRNVENKPSIIVKEDNKVEDEVDNKVEDKAENKEELELENEDKLIEETKKAEIQKSLSNCDETLENHELVVLPVNQCKLTKKLFIRHCKTLKIPKEVSCQIYNFMKNHKIKDYNFILNVLYKYSLENSSEENKHFDLELLMFECKDSSYNYSYNYKNQIKPIEKKRGFLNKLSNFNQDQESDDVKLGVVNCCSLYDLKLFVTDIRGNNHNLGNPIIVESLFDRYLSTLTHHKRNAIASYLNNSNNCNVTLKQLQTIGDQYADHTIKFADTENFTDGIMFNDLNESLDTLIVGMAKKERLMSAEEKLVVAYHEVGHALMGYLVSGGQVPIKISIIPSGRNALGYTKHDVVEKHIVSFEDCVAQIYCLLGGRCCELLKFGKLYSGASDDLRKIDKILDTMICEYNMYSSFGYIKPRNGENHVSDKIMYRIECFKRKLIKMYSKIVKDYLNEFITDVDNLAQLLFQREELTEADLNQTNLSQACIANKGKLVILTKYINL